MLIGKEELAGMIPHAGAMSLLDGVVAWDNATIQCCATSHTDSANPLRSQGGLSAICGIEYAAQAMAAHGRLTGAVGGRPRAGYLISLRDVISHTPRLDTLNGELLIKAERVMGDAHQVIYRFELSHGNDLVLSGRAAAILDLSPR